MTAALCKSPGKDDSREIAREYHPLLQWTSGSRVKPHIRHPSMDVPAYLVLCFA